MSGPKINRYTLSPEAKKNFDEQVHCDRQSFVCAKQVKKMLRDLLDCRSTVEEELIKLRIRHQRLGGHEKEIASLEHFLESFSAEASSLEKMLRANWPVTQQTYTLTDSVLQLKKSRLETLRNMRKTLAACSAPIEKILHDCREADTAQSREIRRDIETDLNGGVSFDRPVRRDDSLQKEKDEVLEQLTGLLLRSDCPASMKDPLQTAVQALERIGSAGHLHTFRSVTVDPLVKRYADAVRAEDAARERLEELKDRYASLCEMTGTEARELPDAALQQAVRELEQQLLADREREYIAACLDEVMAEMGYDLIGSRQVTKKNGKRFRSELFTFSEGTAVNVTYSSDGQIAMELGGIARTDRLPTDAETEALVAEMECFCADFAEIERRLAAKGIVPNRIAMAPPAAEYAAIINAEDYGVDRNVAEMQVSDRKKTSDTKKSMHRGDE